MSENVTTQRLREMNDVLSCDNDKLRLALQRWEQADVRIDKKYGVNGRGRVCNLQSGNEIPEDEPLIVFRAQDRHLPDVLLEYADRCADEEHRSIILSRRVEVMHWQETNQVRVKEPDTDADNYYETDGERNEMQERPKPTCVVKVFGKHSNRHEDVIGTLVDGDGYLILNIEDGGTITYHHEAWNFLVKEPVHD